MSEPELEVGADEVETLAGQLVANHADGLVRLTTVDGSLVAEWISDGAKCSMGPAGLPPSAQKS
jgi:hypothetical protein